MNATVKVAFLAAIISAGSLPGKPLPSSRAWQDIVPLVVAEYKRRGFAVVCSDKPLSISKSQVSEILGEVARLKQPFDKGALREWANANINGHKPATTVPGNDLFISLRSLPPREKLAIFWQDFHRICPDSVGFVEITPMGHKLSHYVLFARVASSKVCCPSDLIQVDDISGKLRVGLNCRLYSSMPRIPPPDYTKP